MEALQRDHRVDGWRKYSGPHDLIALFHNPYPLLKTDSIDRLEQLAGLCIQKFWEGSVENLKHFFVPPSPQGRKTEV